VCEQTRLIAQMGEKASGFGAVGAYALSRQSRTAEKCWTPCLEIWRDLKFPTMKTAC
jgi:hypothetical protein